LEASLAKLLPAHLQDMGLDQRRSQDLGKLGIVAADEAGLDLRRHDRHRIATRAFSGVPDDLELGGIILRRPGAGRPPAVSVTASDVEHAGTGTTDPDWWELALIRFGVEPSVLEPVELTFEVDRP